MSDEVEIEPAGEPTRRQRILDLLQHQERTFESLAAELRVRNNVLEDDLRHLEKSVKRTGAKLRTTPARCVDCGFVFRERSAKHFHAPGRCPTCRSMHIEAGKISVK